jgi:DNA polymerase sigma
MQSKPFSFRPPENISTPVVKEKENVVQLSPCQTTANFDNCAVFSHFNMPPWIPDDFLNITPSDSLERFSFECNCLVKYLKFTAKEDEIREQVFLKVKQTIEGYDSSLRVDMFGSCATGLYLSHSDIDCVISDKYASGRSQIIEKQKVNILKGVLRVFRPYSPTLIRANLPIVKMIDPLHKIQIDVSVNYVESSCAAVPIIKRMASQLPGFTGLVFILKQFLHNRGLDSNATQGIGGYGLLLWIGSFLRIHDTIYKVDNSELDNEESTGRASNVHPLDLIDGNIDKDCVGQADDIGVLFLHFLHFFGFCFDYHKVALAPGGSKNDPERILIPKLELERKYALRLAIMDPLDANNNVTRGTTRITQIIFCFREAYQVLVAGLKNAKGKNKRKGILRLVMNTHLTSRTPDENKLNTKRNLKIADQDSGKKIKKLKKSETPQSDTYSIPVQSTKPLQGTQKKRRKKSKPIQSQPKTNNAGKKVKSSAVSQGIGSKSRYFVTSNNSIEVETVSTSNPGHVFDSQNDFVSLD